MQMRRIRAERAGTRNILLEHWRNQSAPSVSTAIRIHSIGTSAGSRDGCRPGRSTPIGRSAGCAAQHRSGWNDRIVWLASSSEHKALDPTSEIDRMNQTNLQTNQNGRHLTPLVRSRHVTRVNRPLKFRLKWSSDLMTISVSGFHCVVVVSESSGFLVRRSKRFGGKKPAAAAAASPRHVGIDPRELRRLNRYLTSCSFHCVLYHLPKMAASKVLVWLLVCHFHQILSKEHCS